MNTGPGHRFLAAACLTAALLTSSAIARSAGEGPAQVIDAVWKIQSFDFHYQGRGTTYSCGALRDRLRSILMGVGAQDTIIVRTIGCYDLSDLARVHVIMASPVEATPENVRALTQHDSEDELIARMQGVSLATAADIERFPAIWSTVSMSRDKRLKLAPGDCELVQQLRREVFPLLSVRIVQDNLHCSNAFGNIGRPQLAVSALIAATDHRERR
ncbi:MAG: hypothetical protein ACREV5_14035 [Steroidobacter sp.]